ncbi:hypothetical protein [Mesorhizobium sp. CAU 1741]|uniref:hypothetical protein n=1 Tax=Mesorhizobium sp. CAU 1741 TaxID=3140366 RepID=UPI00325B61C7
MAQDRKFADRWSEFKPSKTMWFWTTAGAVVVTMIVGFTAGGWVTGGSARSMAEDAARDGRAELASSLCVEKFTASATAANLAELKETSSYQQDNFIEDGGWTTLAGLEDAVPGAADLCADELVALESLPPRTAVDTVPLTDG